jgi:hypothetical protein
LNFVVAAPSLFGSAGSLAASFEFSLVVLCAQIILCQSGLQEWLPSASTRVTPQSAFLSAELGLLYLLRAKSERPELCFAFPTF